MSWLILNVHSATVLAGAMLPVAVAASRFSGRWARFVAAAALEIAIICGLYALWQVANGLARGHTSGGLARGRDLWNAERWLHLPSEVSVQRLILHHRELVRWANYFYESAHFTTMVVFLLWLWLRHRDRYPIVRNTIVAFTAMSLLIQMVQVAPPRLIGVPGLVDTGQAVGPTPYNGFAAHIADQYAAMPSIHVGWAVLISIAVVKCSPSRWRWLAVLHAVVTSFVVVVTGNHYWLDGIVAVALLVPAYFVAVGVQRVAELLPAAGRRGRYGAIESFETSPPSTANWSMPSDTPSSHR
ncbi:MAG TPA: phosphatase PAP2 family protein [Mycobacteriales bacterium]|nr:phosphatase PAP2 family protein [Mycobacteriales bacterium]